jgi:hypothetical protein
MKTSASALLVSAAAAIATGQQARQDLLTAMHHVSRPVLIFAGPKDTHTAAEQYMALQRHAAATRDRQVHVILLTAAPIAYEQGGAGVPETSVAAPAEQEALRKRFQIAPNTFAVLLIGKDGGEKMRSDRPVPWETLQATIDAMPMRQTEMHEKAR